MTAPQPHASGESLKTPADHEKQRGSQTWEFVTPLQKRERASSADPAAGDTSGDSDEARQRSGSASGDPPDWSALDGLKPPEPRQSQLLGIKEYPAPHPFMQWVRGVPMHEIWERDKPPLNLPVEAQQLLAIHLERAGLVHVDDVRAAASESGWLHVNQLPQQMIKHRRPAEGPDIAINPGTWHPISEPDPSVPSAEPLPVPDFSSATPEQLAVIREGLRREDIRQKMLQHSETGLAEKRAALVDNAATVAAAAPPPADDQDDVIGMPPKSVQAKFAAMLDTKTKPPTPAPSVRPVTADDVQDPDPDAQTLARQRLAKLFTAADPASAPSTSGFTAEGAARMAEMRRLADERRRREELELQNAGSASESEAAT